jgi:predicted nuclease with TOPRIM domain
VIALALDLSALSTRELLDEVAREEGELEEKRSRLREVEDEISRLQEQLEWERVEPAERRMRRRAGRIRELRRDIEERRGRIEERLREIAEAEARLRLLISPFELYATRKRLDTLRRSLRRLEAWQRTRIGQLGWETRQYEAEEYWVERQRVLLGHLDYWRDEARSIGAEIRGEEEALKRKREELAKRRVLSRVKIRLYNFQKGPAGSPEGMFQGFYMIDGLVNPGTGLVEWDWWLTKEEISRAKRHMVAYFKGMTKWCSPDQLSLAYFKLEEEKTRGVPYGEKRVTYGYSKNVPQEFLARAERLTVQDLILGESSREPEPIKEPKPESMGVLCEEMIIIGADGLIKWHEVVDEHVPGTEPSEEEIERLKKELGLKKEE